MLTILVTPRRSSILNRLHKNDLVNNPELAARLLSHSIEQRNLSTSSFRPPGGPTPTRGLFFGFKFQVSSFKLAAGV